MPNALTLLELNREQDAPFVLTTNGSFTRGTLLRLAAGMGARLRDVGASKENVIVSLDSGPDFIASIAGCWLAGATPVLLDPLVRRELLGAVEMTQANTFISGASGNNELEGRIQKIAPDSVEAEPWEASPVADSAPVLWLFTSGSTGKPALVPKTFDQLDVEIRFLSSLLGEPRRVATLVPWCHIFGLLTSLLVPARMHGVCDLSAGVSPKRVLERAGPGLLDLVVAVPAVYQVMVRYLEAGDFVPIPDTCRFTCSGAPLGPALRARFTELSRHPITDLYGSTEAGGVAYRHDEGPWIVEPHVESRIVDDGYLEVRSASVSLCSPGEFYRIGDLVRPEGRGFELVGRSDDVVKIGGRRTSLGEVTEAVEACPGVSNAAVLAHKIRGAQRLVAFVEPTSDGVDSETVKVFVRGRLADHKVPRKVEIMERLPRTPAGKIDRLRLAPPRGEEE
ncbi:MAG: acyl--CoA ligase [Deltaproteobacteria bacterium]|nr:acyl--CoA ligase [Deltaproteobacteria bacterium]